MSTTTVTAREVHLVRRPSGFPEPDDFAFVDRELSEPGEGEVLVANHDFSVDPYMRGRMNDVPSYVAPFRLNEAMDGRSVGEVVASRSDEVAVGDLVTANLAWRTHGVVSAKQVQKVSPPDGVSPSAYLGVLGGPGLTAWVGLLDKAAFREGDSVFVSGAAGAVGSLVGQLAKLKGASRVVGSAGSADKVAWLTGELGYDAAFNYKDSSSSGSARSPTSSARPCPTASTSTSTTSAPTTSRPPSRAPTTSPASPPAGRSRTTTTRTRTRTPGPANLFQIVKKRLSIQGFIVTDSIDRMRAVPLGGHPVGGRGPREVRGDHRRGHRPGRRGVPRHAPRREHREDDRQGVRGLRPT